MMRLGPVKLWVDLVAWMVPRGARAEWREEWHSEIDLGQSQAKHGLPESRVSLFIGTLLDAWSVRRVIAEERNRSGGSLRGAIVHETRLAIRRLARSPRTTILVVTTLAAGIGASTAVFAVVNALLLTPPPYPRAHELVNIWRESPGVHDQATLSVMDMEAIRTRTDVFDGLAAAQVGRYAMSRAGAPEVLNYARVQSQFLGLLGASPLLGRLFNEGDDEVGAEVSVVLTHQFWQSAFAGDPDIVGKSIPINYAAEAPVIGVLTEDFSLDYDFLGLEDLRGRHVDAFFSLPGHPRGPHWNADVLNVIGRLKPGVTLDQAASEVSAVSEILATDEEYRSWRTVPERHVVVSLLDQAVGRARPLLMLLSGATAILLLLACASVAATLLARQRTRDQELAVHIALGADRSRLLLRVFAESLTLAGLGTLIGLALAFVSIEAIQAVVSSAHVPRLAEIEIDRSVFLLSVVLALVTTLLSSLLPAVRAVSVEVDDVIKSGTGGVMKSDLGRLHSFGNGVVAVELALSVVLLIGALLFSRSLSALGDVEPGFDAAHTLSFEARFPRARYRSNAEWGSLKRDLRQRLDAIPGVEGVTIISEVPFNDRGGTWAVEPEGWDEGDALVAEMRYAADDYFDVMGIPFVVGRGLSSEAPRGSEVLVDEVFVARAWPGETSLGRRVHIWRNEESSLVVGVVESVHDGSLEEGPSPTMYARGYYSGGAPPMVYMALRTAVEPEEVLSHVQPTIAAVDPDILVSDLRTSEDRVAETLANRELSIRVLRWYGIVSLLITVVGVSGVVAQRVTAARRALGLRMALGARPGELTTLVLKQIVIVAALGIGGGVVLAASLSQLARGMLFGVSVVDPRTYALASGSLLLIALLAALLPARAAAEVDPVETLRNA